MLKCNIQDMSDLELSDLLGVITAEREKRRNDRKECLWRDVIDAVKAYCKEFGEIEVHTLGDDEWQADIDISSDLEEIGYIGV